MPFFEIFLAQIRVPRPRGDGDADGIRLRRKPQCVRAVKSERADIGGIEVVNPHDFALRGFDLRARKRNLHRANVGGIEKTPRVIRQAKNRRAARGRIGAHTLENAGAVMQPVRQDMDFGIAPFDEFAVEPDFAALILQRHRGRIIRRPRPQNRGRFAV